MIVADKGSPGEKGELFVSLFVPSSVVLFFKTGFYCVAQAHSVDQARLEFIEIYLPLPSKCWN